VAKRFTDTNKYKKPFIRALQGSYKLLWDFLYHDCDHAGIWIVDFEIAQAYVGADMPVNNLDALKFFNADELRIIEIDGGKKWFIPSFIEFQYGVLSEKNRAHINVISVLRKYLLLNTDLSIKKSKPLTSPLQGAKEKEKEQEKEQEPEIEGGAGETLEPVCDEPFSIEPEMPLPENTLIAAELNQFTLTRNKNTEFLKQQWEVFVTERIHDPPEKRRLYRQISDLTTYFLNWVRNKHPNATNQRSHSGGNSTKPGTSEARVQAAKDY
jgi:hypothetical protein